MTETAFKRAADLGRDTECGAVFFRNQDGLDNSARVLSSVIANQKLPCLILCFPIQLETTVQRPLFLLTLLLPGRRRNGSDIFRPVLVVVVWKCWSWLQTE